MGIVVAKPKVYKSIQINDLEGQTTINVKEKPCNSHNLHQVHHGELSSTKKKTKRSKSYRATDQHRFTPYRDDEQIPYSDTGY